MTTRRNFLRAGALAGAGLLLPWKRAFPFAQSPTGLRKFVIALPGLGPSAKNEIGQYIPVATPDTTKFPGVAYYQIELNQYEELLHPDLPKPTRLWGYHDATAGGVHARQYLGPVIVAQSGRPVRVTYVNHLPDKHILPVDHSLMGAEVGQPENRAVVHLHGGLSPWTSDGGPFAWSTPGGKAHGVDWQPGDFLYPNNQSARLEWYHDHALGITRLNAYAGLASAYLITDDAEAGLVNLGAIPDIQIPLIIQEKGFVPPNIHQIDPAWRWGSRGDLWYPHVYEPNIWPDGITNFEDRWDYGPTAEPPMLPGSLAGPLPSPSCVPEGFFDTALVNGAVYPYLNVEPRRYRFRILNGSQARFYNLQLYVADLTGKEANLNAAGPAFIQIGTEGGFLPAPVVLNHPPLPTRLDSEGAADFTKAFNLLLAPAERADVIIDFRGFEGQKLILYSDTPAPFPEGDPRNDYFTGDPDQTGMGGAPSTRPGFGPNTRTVMQIRVATGPISTEPDFTTTLNLLNAELPTAFANTQPPLLSNQVGQYVAGLGKTLNEDFDNYGRLLQRVGTTDQNGFNNQGLPTWGHAYVSKTTENPHQGETQVWNIFNLTGDSHPIHFHLVNVQVISRAPFDSETPDFTAIGTPRPPDANELGWKETVRMNPDEVTTVIMRFDLPSVPFVVPSSPRTGGAEYVWHCHILEHEEHDMMRPLVVSP